MSPSRKPVAKKTSRKSSAGRVTFSSRVKKLEKQVGQKQLAKMLGVTPRSIRRYKQGTRKPRKDVVLRTTRAARAAKGLRPTKSVTKKRQRAEKIYRTHPEVLYFEKRKGFEFADTEHIDLLNVSMDDIEGLLAYLEEQGCEAAYFVIRGTDEKTGNERWASSEIMNLEDLAEAWEEELDALLAQYELMVSQIDLIGIKYNAPTSQAG